MYTPKHLGQGTSYPEKYDPSLLEAIPRAPGRAQLGIETVPFKGWDDWQAFELGWLNERGKAISAVLLLRLSADTPNIVESKSLKLYLQSFHMTQIAFDAVLSQIKADLEQCLGSSVSLELNCLSDTQEGLSTWGIQPWRHFSSDAMTVIALDDLDFACEKYLPEKTLLKIGPGSSHPTLYFTDSFRSLCPVTGQPDFASIAVLAGGAKIQAESLGQYLTSFRGHQGFHEQCVEHMFIDILSQGNFDLLGVIGRFTRRGGIDINPARFLNPQSEALLAQMQTRQWRQ